ncbi:MAG: sugar ABC transporter permease [Ruminococcaceae bacterium]|nr:sugar ABC transporter permease [Oscillospiraceae bacterium]
MALVKKGKSNLLRKRGYYGYFFILPLIIGVLFVFIPNLYHTFQYSVSSLELGKTGYDATFEGFSQYKAAFTKDANFVPYLVNELKSFLTDVPVITIFSMFIAVLLNGRFRGRTIARLIFFIPVILSTGIISSIEANTDLLANVESNMASSETSLVSGLSNMLLQMNLPDFIIDIIDSAISGIYSVVQRSGMQIFILLTGLQEIPPSLYEAAEVEGCNGWESFWKITFPMMGPHIRISIVYTIVDLTSRTDTVLAEYINLLAFRSNMFSLGTAMYVIYLLIVLIMVGIVLYVLNRFIKYNGEVG